MEARRHYGKVTDDVVASLMEIAGKKNVLTGDERENYSRDESPKLMPALPEAVVKPENTAAVAGVLKLADRKRIPVTPRGGGTGLSGGAVPTCGGIVLSVEKLNKILEIDKDNSAATVESGVVLSDFYRAVEAQGLYYPLYPGETSATIGGNVATNAGGMQAVKYGVTKHFVLGLEAVLPGGEVIRTGGKFVKCATAYDLTQLLTGSEGTLAVITRVMLKLVPRPGRREVLFIPFHNLHDAISTVPEILKGENLPVGIEFMQRDIITLAEHYTGKEIPFHDHEAFLMIIVEADSEDEMHMVASSIGSICLQHGAVDVFIAGGERARKRLLEFREKFYHVVKHEGMLDLADVVVPRSRIADFTQGAKAIGSRFGIPVIIYGHAGDGNVHLHFMGQQGNDKQALTLKELFTEIYRVGAAMGGMISGEHGIGSAKKGYLPIAIDKNHMELMKRVKRAFDPHDIMNPGKIFDID